MPLCCNFIPVYTVHTSFVRVFFHKIFFETTNKPHLQPLGELKAEKVAGATSTSTRSIASSLAMTHERDAIEADGAPQAGRGAPCDAIQVLVHVV
jgi:hypothetical protein